MNRKGRAVCPQPAFRGIGVGSCYWLPVVHQVSIIRPLYADALRRTTSRSSMMVSAENFLLFAGRANLLSPIVLEGFVLNGFGDRRSQAWQTAFEERVVASLFDEV